MAKIVVMGAGLGGVACAYEMKKKVGSGHQVTLVGSSPYFEFTPSNPWMMVGWRTAPQTRVELEKPLAAKDIAWVPRLVQAIDAPASRLTLDDGTGLDYDYLVIATGPKLAFEEVPGLGPEGIHAVGLHARPCLAGLGAIPAVRAGTRSGRRRRGGRRELLRARLRDRDDSRHRPAPSKDPRPRADGLRNARALHRAHGPRRRRRQQGADGVRNAPAAHHLDHQREDHGRGGRRDDGRRARRGRHREEGAQAALQVFDGDTGVQGRGSGRCGAGTVQPARLRADRRAPALEEVPQHLLGRSLRRDPARRGDARRYRRAEDRLHDRVHGQRDLRERRGRPGRKARHGPRPPGTRSASPTSATPAPRSSRCRRSRRATSPGRSRASGCTSPRSRSRSISCAR